MKSKLRRVLSFFCAVLVLYAFLVSKPRIAKAEPITVTTAVIWAITSLLSSMGVGMAVDEDFRNVVITGVKNIPQWGGEILAKIQASYMGAAGLAVATIAGKDYIQLKASDLSLAASMLKNQLPTTISYEKDSLSLSGFDSTIDLNYEYVYSYNEKYNFTGRWYIYNGIKVNPESDLTASGIIDASIFYYQPISCSDPIYKSSSVATMGFLVLTDSPAYEFLCHTCANTIFASYDVATNKSVWNLEGYLDCAYQSYSQIQNNPYTLDFDGKMQIDSNTYSLSFPIVTYDGVVEKKGFNTEGTGYRFSSALGLVENTITENAELSQLKTMYGELSKLLDQLIKDNPSLANDVISVPVDDDTIGNDLPGLLAMLKQLDVNSAQGVQDLISAIERALAKADAEAIATAGTLTGIAEGVDVIESDISDIKEKAKDIAEALTEEADVPFNKMTLPQAIATRFPFCIPFDLYNSFTNLGSLSRTAPKWTLPWTVKGTTANVEVDLAEFEEWAKVIRWGTLVAFNIGLILVTRRLIKG